MRISLLAMALSGLSGLSSAALAERAEVRSEDLDPDDEGDGDVLVDVRTVEDDVADPGRPGEKRQVRKMFKKMMKLGPESFLGKYKHVWKGLGLTSEQKDKLFALQQKFKKVAFDLEQAKEKGRFDLQKLLHAASIDEGRIEEATTAVADAVKMQLTSHVEFVKEMRGILTPEQLKSLHEQLARSPDRTHRR